MCAMSLSSAVRKLRPFLSARFQEVSRAGACSFSSSSSAKSSSLTTRGATHDHEKRLSQLRASQPESDWYPRLERATVTPQPIQQVRRVYDRLHAGEAEEGHLITVTGRVKSIRKAGAKLCFVDLEDDVGHSLQAVCNFARLQPSAPDLAGFRDRLALIHRGDCYAVTGHVHRTKAGELSIRAESMPTLLAPTLHQVPEALDDAETRAHHRHIDMLVNPAAVATLRVRHLVERHLQAFLNDRGFISVKTPIIEADAGGAVARPFVTTATELSDQPLHLRIAPELWLKRLVIGGLTKVYEIGPAFRNEGVDATHNPEFHTCEFYQAYATLGDLLRMTELMLRTLSERIASEPDISTSLSPPDESIFANPFRELEFIPTLERVLGHTLPDLSEPVAAASLRSIFSTRSIPLPESPTLPCLLDALSARYIEPLTEGQPTFILHHPAALSPLSKHFICPKTNQRVAARAELFYCGREYANMYEEENSPFEQRAKFEAQARFKAQLGESTGKGATASNSEAGTDVDEAYLQALEWGLPPTGGWGCGIDRLVMLFSGRERIADVLSFGSLRNVVAQARRR